MSDTFSSGAAPGLAASMLNDPTVYRHSGKVSPVSLAVAAIVLIPLGIALGAIYSAIVVYLPFIKLRGLVTFFSGVALGAIAGRLCYRLKFRSRLMTFLTIIGFSTVAYYTAWAVHPALVIGPSQLGKDFVPMLIQGFDPMMIMGWMQGIFTGGIWAMGAGGGALSGWAAVAVWVVEAGLIYVMAYITGMRTFGNRPFCENCNRWTDETEDLAVLPVATTDPAWAQIRNGNFGALKKLQIASDREGAYVELRLADCSTCEESDYLSAIGITLTMHEGQLKKNESEVFRHLSVTRAQRDEIVAFAAAMAEAVQVMEEAELEELATQAEGVPGNDVDLNESPS